MVYRDLLDRPTQDSRYDDIPVSTSDHHFRSERFYVLVDVFHETSSQNEVVQLIDLITPEVFTRNTSTHRHIQDRVLLILPPRCLCNASIAESHRSRSTHSHLSRGVPQIQDGFLNSVGTPEQIGNIGTDILDNSWVINLLVRNVEFMTKTTEERMGRRRLSEGQLICAISMPNMRPRQ
jgi:hypothetical protein